LVVNTRASCHPLVVPGHSHGRCNFPKLFPRSSRYCRELSRDPS